jgi:preprotein translocase subunit YajC
VSAVEPYLVLVLIVVAGYLLLIRPGRNRAKQAANLQSALSPGDEVMLTSGVFATVRSVSADEMHVEVAPGVVLRVHRQAVARIVIDQPSGPPDAADDGYESPDATVDGRSDDSDSDRGVI